MNIVFFYHSVISDWNNGNAHFLRGIATEFQSRGHNIEIFEPAGGWSLENLKKNYGQAPIAEFHRRFPHLKCRFYPPDNPDIPGMIKGADLVLVHEWNDTGLVKQIGAYHRENPHFLLFFHDTHHRAQTQPHVMATYDLSEYDGVLAFGDIIRDIYIRNGWTHRAWTWHEAADINVFYPVREKTGKMGDLVWIGNWGDEERTAEYREFLLEPVKSLGLNARAYGVQYPPDAVAALEKAGISYHGWLPNYDVPRIYSGFRVTVHIPRGYYASVLPGIPTIRPFEALACGIPLISAPWSDSGRLFTVGKDYLAARNGREMRQMLKKILDDPLGAARMAAHGRRKILRHHTCAHRVDELMNICDEINSSGVARFRKI